MLIALLLCLLHSPAAPAIPRTPPASPAASASEDFPSLLPTQTSAQPEAQPPTTQPTTQPAAGTEATIDLLKVFKGEQKLTAEQLVERSEERRVGKEWRWRWAAD